MIKKSFLLLILPLSLCVSCIQDEAPNAECDILAVEEAWLEENKDIIIGTPIVQNDRVSVMLKIGTDRTALNPSFVLTEGATLTMVSATGQEVDANGVVRDFSTPQVYTTHSEDGAWKKEYRVSFAYPNMLNTLSFEHFVLDGAKNKYYRWVELAENNVDTLNYWASGNAGFAFTGVGTTPSLYPTSVSGEGVNGNCVKLTTSDTGLIAQLNKKPIAAGNIFIGEFNSENAMKKPLEATRFGLQLVDKKPSTLSGWYKYTPGEIFTDKDKKEVVGMRDECSIYSVVFEVDPKDFVPLDGSNILSSERIVMVAQVENPGEPKDWTYFEAPYKLREGKIFDNERLKNNGYAITVVASSSKAGDFFEGAIGSTLYIDEFAISWKNE
ncbi:MAG: PCMD domain-containing protein [Bacteroidaceae bacterium]|nr:PCMD domain-containing protein [Bacteroidaceae bacterium]